MVIMTMMTKKKRRMGGEEEGEQKKEKNKLLNSLQTFASNIFKLLDRIGLGRTLKKKRKKKRNSVVAVGRIFFLFCYFVSLPVSPFKFVTAFCGFFFFCES